MSNQLTTEQEDLLDELRRLTDRLHLLDLEDPESDRVAERIDEINAKLRIVKWI